MSEPQKIAAMVSVLNYRRNRTDAKAPNRRQSEYEKHGDGRISILQVIHGEAPEEKKKPLVISFERDHSPHVRYKKGDILQVEGYIETLTKSEDILYVTQSCIPTDVGERFFQTRYNISSQEQRNTIIKEGQGFMLRDQADSIDPALRQEPLALQDFLSSHGFDQDIDFSANLCARFTRRVRNRKAEDIHNVPQMIEKNPLVLSDIYFMDTHFTPQNIVRQFHIQPSDMAKVYSEVVAQLCRAEQAGDTFLPFSRLYGFAIPYLDGKPRDFLWNTLTKGLQQDPYLRSMAKLKYCTFCSSNLRSGWTTQFEGMSEDAMGYFTSKLNEELPEQESKNNERASRLVFHPVFYLIKNYFSEIRCAEEFAKRLGKSDDFAFPYTVSEKLTDEQAAAVRNAFDYRTSVITGSAGSGKTAVVSEIVRIACENKKRAILLAPSAKAALHAAEEVRNNSEDVKVEHQTIHRFAKILLEDEDSGESGDFLATDDEKGIAYDMLIIDEMSMCTLSTFYRVLKVLKSSPKTHLVLVGDPMQLPAIGPQFFHQVADGLIGDMLPVVSLTKNFRAKSNALAHFGDEIRHGVLPTADGVSVHLEEESLEDFKKQHMELLKDEDTMFLTVRREDATLLNHAIRNIRHPKAEQIGNSNFYVGDKVISTTNDYYDEERAGNGIRHPDRTFDVYNGTDGVIEAWDKEKKSVTVRLFSPEFPDEGKLVMYGERELNAYLAPAFAITVHKSQGSQYRRVVFFLSKNTQRNLSRNLLYTAVTRAEKEIYMVGDSTQFEEVVSRMAHFGNSFFAFRVRKHLDVLLEKEDAEEIVLSL